MKLYHLSEINHNGETFHPILMTPDRAMWGEDCTVKRTCFSSSIQGAINALSFSEDPFKKDCFLYVHTPTNLTSLEVYKPDKKEVPDCEFTNEYWVLNDVTLKCLGKVIIINRIKNYYTTYYQDWKIQIDKYIWKWKGKYDI